MFQRGDPVLEMMLQDKQARVELVKFMRSDDRERVVKGGDGKTYLLRKSQRDTAGA